MCNRPLTRSALLIGLLWTPAALASSWDTADADGDGYSVDEGDCNDGDPEINPGVREICDDGFDNDCDLAADFDDPQCTPCGACGTFPGRAGFVSPAALAVALWWRRRLAAG